MNIEETTRSSSSSSSLMRRLIQGLEGGTKPNTALEKDLLPLRPVWNRRYLLLAILMIGEILLVYYVIRCLCVRRIRHR